MWLCMRVLCVVTAWKANALVTWAGTHCEGGVWATLFGLLLWPALFAAVPDALRRYFIFQSAGGSVCSCKSAVDMLLGDTYAA